MILDAILAYLHFVSIFALFGFLTAEAILIRRALDSGTIRLLGRVDIFYFGAAIAVLVSGFLRLVLGVKGADFYLQSWPIYAKIGLFVVVAVISVAPTLMFIRWRRFLDHDAAWQPPVEEVGKARRLVMIEIHLAALIPIFAVIMSRGLAR
jgi:putative membrane protein